MKDFKEEIEGWKTLPLSRNFPFFYAIVFGKIERIYKEELIDLAFGC